MWDCMAVGWMWASGPCHSSGFDSLICFSVGCRNMVHGRHWSIISAALGEAAMIELAVGLVECEYVGLVECTVDGTIICLFQDALSLFLVLILIVHSVNTIGTGRVSAVGWNKIQRSLTQVPVMVIKGDYMVHLRHRNVVVYPAVAHWMIESTQSWTIGVYWAFTSYYCEMLTSLWWVRVTVLSSPRSMTIYCRTIFIELNLAWLVKRWWDDPESVTHAAGTQAPLTVVVL